MTASALGEAFTSWLLPTTTYKSRVERMLMSSIIKAWNELRTSICLKMFDSNILKFKVYTTEGFEAIFHWFLRSPLLLCYMIWEAWINLTKHSNIRPKTDDEDWRCSSHNVMCAFLVHCEELRWDKVGGVFAISLISVFLSKILGSASCQSQPIQANRQTTETCCLFLLWNLFHDTLHWNKKALSHAFRAWESEWNILHCSVLACFNVPKGWEYGNKWKVDERMVGQIILLHI